MPWKSVAQARWGHSAAGREALGVGGVKEWDDATPEGSLKGTKGSHEAKTASQRHHKKLKKGEFRRNSYNWRDYE